jgi:hypothetical protein
LSLAHFLLTLDIGEDTGAPVSEDYHPPFKFTGTIGKVVILLGDEKISNEVTLRSEYPEMRLAKVGNQ